MQMMTNTRAFPLKVMGSHGGWEEGGSKQVWHDKIYILKIIPLATVWASSLKGLWVKAEIPVKRLEPRKELQRPIVSFHEVPLCRLHFREIPCLSPDTVQLLARPQKGIKAKQNKTIISMAANQKKKEMSRVIYQLRCQLNFTSKQNISKVASEL